MFSHVVLSLLILYALNSDTVYSLHKEVNGTVESRGLQFLFEIDLHEMLLVISSFLHRVKAKYLVFYLRFSHTLRIHIREEINPFRCIVFCPGAYGYIRLMNAHDWNLQVLSVSPFKCGHSHIVVMLEFRNCDLTARNDLVVSYSFFVISISWYVLSIGYRSVASWFCKAVGTRTTSCIHNDS